MSGDSREGSQRLRASRNAYGESAVWRHRARACLAYVPETKVGDYVLVHVGFAISRVDEEEAQRTYQILKEMDQLTELEAPIVNEVRARDDDGDLS